MLDYYAILIFEFICSYFKYLITLAFANTALLLEPAEKSLVFVMHKYALMCEYYSFFSFLAFTCGKGYTNEKGGVAIEAHGY